MNRFLVMVFAMPLGDLLWWYLTNRRFRQLRVPRLWRLLLLAWFTVVFAGFIGVIITRGTGINLGEPRPLLACIYIWHLVVLPISLCLILLSNLFRGVLSLIRTTRARPPAAIAADLPPSPATPSLATPSIDSLPSRRQFLAAGAAMVPPLFAVGLTARGLNQIGQFRVTHLTVPVPGLPPALDGFTIAHVSDVHAGRFMWGKHLTAIADATNRLRADLVLMTGDLIDYTVDDLPPALAMLKSIRSPYGTFVCEGNHDLFQGRGEFERRVTRSDVPLLLNDSRTLDINGQKLQLLGIRWGGATLDRRNAGSLENTLDVIGEIRSDAFPILLAHHPHAFDPAAHAGIPLVLAGHTHGGQIMLTRNIGPGPMMFKYWSGLYRKPTGTLVVSNGVGNWFPLRINAPAEIARLTLRPA